MYMYIYYMHVKKLVMCIHVHGWNVILSVILSTFSLSLSLFLSLSPSLPPSPQIQGNPQDGMMVLESESEDANVSFCLTLVKVSQFYTHTHTHTHVTLCTDTLHIAHVKMWHVLYMYM